MSDVVRLCEEGASGDDRSRILIADPDVLVRDGLAGFLAGAGFHVRAVGTARAALDTLRDWAVTGPAAVVLAETNLPDRSGIDFLGDIHEASPSTVPLVVTAHGTIETAVRAIRRGAIDYLIKPVVDDELLLSVEKAVQRHMLTLDNARIRSQLARAEGFDEIVGADARMRRIFDVIGAVAPSRTTVLMNGESGTGKSMIARAIHRKSDRAEGPFVEIACGSIPETLLESELFGHMRGAFTGAHVDKPGRFLAADGGTIFLDEINSASPGMQLKLLRVLQEKCFEPIGSNETVNVDVRVVLASNQPLEELVAAGTFRQDLYYRINVVAVNLPPLRERTGDIPTLARHMLAIKSVEAGRAMTGIDDEAIDALRAYSWPGNVRELENVMERAAVLSRGNRVTFDDLPESVRTGCAAVGDSVGAASSPFVSPGPYQPMPLREALIEPEKQIILAALEAHEWNRQRTADVLGINRTTLYKKIRQYGLESMGRTG